METTQAVKEQDQKETSVSDMSAKFSDIAKLDMVFVMDATGSMGSYIAAAQQTIRDIVQEIVSKEKADVRFALISYRDHPPQESTYVTNIFEFSSSVKQMRDNLDTLSASGGGDGPEAVVDGLHAALKLDYRSDATKVCILIADAPPHGLDRNGDGFPEGCPCELDPIAVCRDMAQNGITLYCVGCEPSLTQYKSFFMALCRITGGQYCPLGDAATLSSAVVGGVREEISLERIMGEVNAQLAECKDMSEEAQVKFVQQKLDEKGVRANRLNIEGASNEMTADAVEMSKAPSLAAAREKFVPAPGSMNAPCFAASSYGAPCFAPCMVADMAGGPAPAMRAMAMPMAAAMHAPMAAPMMARFGAAEGSAPASASGAPSYSVVEDAVSYSQCERLLTKNAARNKLG